ncbi:hypothetical protein J4N45_22180 [Vibrio sp. SCSIO 43140]|uniref:hypothetical protein n=1 Tax=Vibrio sp. SCSIO 43140 TaxID=2819100 RepID=UPI002075BA32|nr:hypothetical protein [Vibrio sp. SCSIO 43140]USD63680.1 hypothetical protein J4N45_22180 [Vibrio sp. SCSIO 43140]
MKLPIKQIESIIKTYKCISFKCIAHLLILGSVSVSALAADSDTQSMTEASHKELFDEQVIGRFIDNAFAHKSDTYTDYAILFNLCQQDPNNELCGSELDVQKAQYQRAKASHDSLAMVWKSEFKDLMLPPMAYQQMVNELKQLGYLTQSTDVPVAKVHAALNQWLVKQGLAPTQEIYLMHGYLVSSAALLDAQSDDNAEQTSNEKTGS